MMRQIFCFAFSVTFIAVYGQQDCNGDFVSYHSCVAQFRQNQLLNRRDANKINNDISQCFITSGCQQPVLPQIPQGMQESREKMNQCYHKAQDFAREPVQKCMVDVKLFSGFTLPKDNAWQGEPSDDPRTKSNTDFEARKQVATLCLSSESRTTVRSCLNNIRKSTSAFIEVKQKCDADKECFKKISKECQKKFDIMKDTVCECASQTLGNLKEEFDKNFRSCYGTTTPDDNKLVGYLIKEICHLDETCVELVDAAIESN